MGVAIVDAGAVNDGLPLMNHHYQSHRHVGAE